MFFAPTFPDHLHFLLSCVVASAGTVCQGHTFDKTVRGEALDVLGGAQAVREKVSYKQTNVSDTQNLP